MSIRYPDLVSTLPSDISVLAWPVHQSKRPKTAVAPATRKELIPARLAHAEDALRSMSLPEGWTWISLLSRFCKACLEIINL